MVLVAHLSINSIHILYTFIFTTTTHHKYQHASQVYSFSNIGNSIISGISISSKQICEGLNGKRTGNL